MASVIAGGQGAAEHEGEGGEVEVGLEAFEQFP